MQVRQLSLAEVKPYWRNPRINDETVPGVKASIEQFGFRQPILVDRDMVIITGHTRYRAAMELALATVPVIVCDDMDPEKVKAYRIADNKPGEKSRWDEDRLLQELRELPDVKSLGIFFEAGELDRLLEGVTDFNTDTASAGQIAQSTQTLGAAEQNRSEEAQGRYISTICPHCAKPYFLDRGEVLRERTATPEEGATVVKLSG